MRKMARGKKPEKDEHKEGYSPRECVEGFAIRIRAAQKSGSSVLSTIGYDRLEAYANGIEDFLVEHDTILAQLEEYLEREV